MGRKRKSRTLLPADGWVWGCGVVVRPCADAPRMFEYVPYQLSETDNLFLRATLRVWGGSSAFLFGVSPEDRRAAIQEDSRMVTWRNALDMAEVLSRNTPYVKEFVVLYCPEGQFDSDEELIRIYSLDRGETA